MIDEFACLFKNPVLRQAIRSMKSLTSYDDFFVIPFLIGTEGEGFPGGGSFNFARSI